MRIIKITDENLAEHLDDLVALSDGFLQIVCDQAPRGSGERAVIASMVASAPSTAILKVEGDDGAAIGVSYFNHGTGYACGGAYLWLNCIYIRSEFQRRGYGSRLLDHIVEGGKRQGIKLFITCRHLENDVSRRLFDRAGFTQEEKMLMTQSFD